MLWNFRCLLLYFISEQPHYVRTTWSSSNSSSFQLLGLFQDTANASDPPLLAVHSRAMFKAAILLSQQYNMTIEGQFIEWQSAHTGGDVIDALSSACQAVTTSNIVGIVGPGLLREAHIIAAFGATIGIPVISYAATDPDLSDRNAYPAFYRTVPSDNAAASSIVKLFIRFNWTSCVIIYQNDVFGSDGAKVISEAFVNNNLIVRDLIVFDIATLSIQGDLRKQLTSMATRIVVLWVQSSYTPLILQDALDSDVLGPQFTWIISSNVPLNTFNQTFSQNLIGMLTVEPVIGTVVGAPMNTTLLDAAYHIWQQYEPETFPGSTNVNYYALFAFDATWALIQSLQQLCSTMNNNSCVSFTGPTYCFHRRFVNSNLFFDLTSTTAFLGVSGAVMLSPNITDRISGTYYYAQNSQPSSNGVSFAPVLEYTDPGDWKAYTGANVIVWSGNSLIIPSDSAILSGISLRIGIIESTPFTIITNVIDESGRNTTKITGYVPDLIDLLKTKMGFIPTLELAASNQTYSGLIQSVKNGDYDMVIGDVTVTSARSEIVGFSSSIFDNSLRIIMRKTPAVNVDLLSYLHPFSFNLWAILLAANVYAAFLICLLERQENEALQNRSIVSAVAMSLWYSFGNIVGYGADFHVTTAAGRLLTVGLYMLSLVLVASYTANLASDLTILKSKDIISGIDDIKNGKIPFNRIGIRVNTAGEDFYLREISGGSRNFYSLKSRQELYDSLLNGIIDVSFMDIGVAEYITNTIYCNLTLIGADFDTSAFGIVIPKQWLYGQDLDVNILLLRESGDLDDLKKKWFQTQNCPDAAETYTAMGIESMGGLFLTFGVITVLSLLLFVWKKRFIIKNYLFVSAYWKDWLSKKKHSMIKRFNKISKRSQNSPVASSTVERF